MGSADDALTSIVIPTSIVAMIAIAVAPTPAALAASTVTPRKKGEDRKDDSGAPAALA